MCARIDVSIHAPRVGCDFDKALKELARYGFNSRTPCGVRHIITITILVIPRFQFTHPVWGATSEQIDANKDMQFQFTHPVWGATNRTGQIEYVFYVSIHAPRVGCDRVSLSRPRG